jgi:hypothetical protein
MSFRRPATALWKAAEAGRNQPMSGGGPASTIRPPSGGRHGRAQELAQRRAEGGELGDYERRVLEAHLAACERCRDWADGLTVVAGQEEEPRATVEPVEATVSHEGDQERGRSDVDAMGQDKRRRIIGESYGPSKGRQLVYYGIFILFLVLLYIGGKVAIDQLDKAPAHDATQAPWAQPNSPQTPAHRFQ